MNKKILFISLILIAALVGVGVAYAVTSIFSATSNPLTSIAILPTGLTAPTWTGSTSVGSTITLSTTLSPNPTNNQQVQFFYTTQISPPQLSASNQGTTASTSWVPIGSAVTSSGITASTTFTLASTQATYFFAAEIASPS
jgi:hypothetical protein